jgi:hypothetical protein
MKRLLYFTASAGVVCFLFWLGGFDFDQRGQPALACALCALLAGFIATGISLDLDP